MSSSNRTEVPIRFGFQRFARRVLRIVFRLLLRCRVTGIESVPPSGRLVVIMNHTSFLDPVLVAVIFPRDIAIMSKIENMQTPVLGKIVEWFGSFPVRRGEMDIGAVKTSMEVLKSECALLLAPEGTRSRNAQLQPAHDGMAMLAIRTRSPVIPVGISGAERFSSQIRRLRRTQITLAIGEPFVFLHDKRRASRHDLGEMTHEAMSRIAALLPEAYRGVFANPESQAMLLTAPSGDSMQARHVDGRVGEGA